MKPTKLKQPPGERIIRLCKKSVLAKHLLAHFDLEQLANDYFLLWHEAPTEKEKKQICDEYEKEVWLALVVPFGVHAGEAAVINVVFTSNPVASIGYLMVGLGIWTFIRRFL